MGIFSGKNRVKSQSSITTLIAEGCTVNGHIKVANRLQIDGYVEGRVEANDQLKISKSGSLVGEIFTERLIINGSFEGTCHAKYIEILSCGRVSGTIYSDNLSIELGGKFMGITNPSDTTTSEQETIKEQDSISKMVYEKETISEIESIYEQEDSNLNSNVTLMSNDSR